MKELISQILSSKTTVVIVSVVAVSLMLGGFEALHVHPHI